MVVNDVIIFIRSYWLMLTFISALSYLIGGINFSIITARFLGGKADIRNLGSGNAGFTNVLRSIGPLPAIITFIGDFAKGVLVVWGGKHIASLQPDIANNYQVLQYIGFLCGLFCVIGHVYPCFFGFRGGKGVLTSWAVTLLIDFRIFIIIISVFIVILILTKIVSLSSICAAISYPITTFLVTYWDYHRLNGNIYYVIICTSISFLSVLIVLYKHHSNISRIMSGTEKKITDRKTNMPKV